MTPEALTSLINLGSAGAVIAVVMIFLNFVGKRDQEWRDFFTLLNKANTDDMVKFASLMERISQNIDGLGGELRAHDSHVDERIRSIVNKVKGTVKP